MKKLISLTPALSFIFLMLIWGSSLKLSAQAKIGEEAQSIKTYPFSDPNPIPTMGIGKKVFSFYPYYVFDGYSTTGEDKDWKVVTLDNPYIEVTVLPEVGGKVMGAIEKSTGKEFVYLNHVMKFRAIGIRGPWTSGGIEHNFGLDLGHAPWAAAAVDYTLRTNDDGSVSCFVGGLDLASRSQWRVEIRLPKDKAHFETNSLWYNPTPLHDAYLSWENAAFKASDDLQFYFPGTYHIGHDGSTDQWPLNKNGLDLSLYKNTIVGGNKSYHVGGTYTDWFGGYWHDQDFGFGHWAPYSDAPGKKVWIWSLAREGAIWEDLLTDSDGQYIEAQSGVKFNQASEDSGFHSPFNQHSLGPFYTETKTEYWFPVKATEGMVDASPYGTLNVETTGRNLKISISPISEIDDTLKITQGDSVIHEEQLHLKPMEDYTKAILLPQGINAQEVLKVRVGKDNLYYSSTPENINDRPVTTPNDVAVDSPERLYLMAEDERAMRDYVTAMKYYQTCLEQEPNHNKALTRMAELHYRKGEYSQGLKFAKKVLETNTYDGGANYIYGVLERIMGNLTNASEAFSVSARTMEFRAGAYTQMAGIALQNQDYELAENYAQQALTYNTNNLLAHQLLGSTYRKLDKSEKAQKLFKKILKLDPLNHYARFEQYLLEPISDNLNDFKSAISNELPFETYLELALEYRAQGLNEEAISVLQQAPNYPIVSYWLAYLTQNIDSTKSMEYLQNAIDTSPYLVFPFRLETIPVLNWAQDQLPSWKNNYYLGLIYWSKSNFEKAQTLFNKCTQEPDYAPFYITRGLLSQTTEASNPSILEDFKKANQLNPKEWRTWHAQNSYYQQQRLLKDGLAASKKAYKKFPRNPIISMDYAKSLLANQDYEKCIQVLQNTEILPQEGAREGHDIYLSAQIFNAIKKINNKKYKPALKDLEAAKLWPEHLGVGKPHAPDDRLIDYLAAYCEDQLGNWAKADALEKGISVYSSNLDHWNGKANLNALNNYIGATILEKLGKKNVVDKLMNAWKTQQDSIRHWGLESGSSEPALKWVFAKYHKNDIGAKKAEEELSKREDYIQSELFFKALPLSRTEE